jgi:hypothetical protein
MNEKQISDQNKSSCNCCCKLKLIFMSVVALSLSLIALCAVVKTFARCDRDSYRGKWKQECGEWGRGERMGGCRMKKMGMMNCPMSKDMEDDIGEDDMPRRRGPENRPDKK